MLAQVLLDCTLRFRHGHASDKDVSVDSETNGSVRSNKMRAGNNLFGRWIRQGSP